MTQVALVTHLSEFGGIGGRATAPGPPGVPCFGWFFGFGLSASPHPNSTNAKHAQSPFIPAKLACRAYSRQGTRLP